MLRRLLPLLAACHGAGAVERVASDPLRIDVAQRGKVDDRVLLTGELRAASAVDLSVPRTDTWQLAIRWMAEDGAQVKAGERVLEFDNSAFTKELEQKKLAYVDAEMTFAGAKDLSAIETQTKQVELEQHRIALEKATVKADVPADLLSVREAQERQLDKKRMQVAVKKAEEDLAAQKAEAEQELRVKQIAVEKAKRDIEAAKKSIDELVETAPRDGILVIGDHPWLGRKFRVGDTVQPGMAIMSLPDLAGGMEVRAELSDVDDGRIHVGEQGTCTLDAYPEQPIACTVKQLTPVARPKEGRGSLRRAFEVTVEMAKSEATWRPGMSVKVELRRPPLENVIVVPRGAVVDGKVRMASGEWREVGLGACDAQRCAVDRGIAEGEKVRE